MSQFFNVQMNIQDVPNVQNEQSSSTSIATHTTDPEHSFNAVLQKILPATIGNRTSSPDTASQSVSSDNQNQNSAVIITADTIDQPLLLSDDNNLKTNIFQLFSQFESVTPTEELRTIPSTEQANIQFHKNTLLEFINTYFTGNAAEEVNNTLKHSGTELPQSNPANNVTPLLVKQDEFAFGAATKNFGELQNLLVDKARTDSLLPQSTPAIISPEQQSLLKRIQTLITEGREAGTLSIKNIQSPENSSSLRDRLVQNSTQVQSTYLSNNDTAATSPLVKGDGFTALEEGVFAPSLRNRQQQQLSGVRHDSTQQFYDAKTQTPNVMGESPDLTENQQKGGQSQSSTNFNQMSSTAPFTENGSTFSLSGSTTLDPLTGQISDPAKITMLPSGTIVQDQEVMQQLVERFQINRRQLESKIQLKLHPVELGKMEIELTVKEGSIRANVVAQSQHVQEILERNITKLRSILEQQGFNVEDISVTSGSETVGEFDLFDQQSPHRDASIFLADNDNREPQTPFDLEDSDESDDDPNSGVNVKV